MSLVFPPAALALASAGALGMSVVALWALSLRLKDASIADSFWGLGFVIVAALGFWLGGGELGRRALVFALVAAWGLRLSGYLLWRARGRGEDARYAAMRREHGDRWPLVSLGTVFLLQGALIWLVSLPVQTSQSAVLPLGWLDAVGAALVAVGIATEATGDFQLARFKADPANKGRVMDRGLWRYTRHPNYFGDFCVWWGLFGLAFTGGAGIWTIVSPLVMSFLLLRVSGVTLLEKHMGDRPGYAEYVRRTSPFFPWPPKA